jgi:hypothetical protein
LVVPESLEEYDVTEDRKAPSPFGGELEDALKEDVTEEIKSAHDPGIESDEEIDGEIDAEGGEALHLRRD